jgi:hypothetical protein
MDTKQITKSPLIIHGTTLSGIQGPKLERVGLHRQELYTSKEIGSLPIRAGLYHPHSNNITTVYPGGTSIKKYKQSRASRN